LHACCQRFQHSEETEAIIPRVGRCLQCSWLEQGRDVTVSEQVLDSLAETFQLEREERRHLFLLARGMVPVADESSDAASLPTGLQAVLDALGTNPAFLIDQR